MKNVQRKILEISHYALEILFNFTNSFEKYFPRTYFIFTYFYNNINEKVDNHMKVLALQLLLFYL